MSKRYLFTYKAECLMKPDHIKHSGMTVEIVRNTGIKHGSDLLMEVKADDGWEGYAYMSELTPV
jgi:hypothetical protein